MDPEGSRRLVGEATGDVSPGPPEEKLPPPPRRNCSTVTAMEPLKSDQPPANSNASIECICTAPLIKVSNAEHDRPDQRALGLV